MFRLHHETAPAGTLDSGPLSIVALPTLGSSLLATSTGRQPWRGAASRAIKTAHGARAWPPSTWADSRPSKTPPALSRLVYTPIDAAGASSATQRTSLSVSANVSAIATREAAFEAASRAHQQRSNALRQSRGSSRWFVLAAAPVAAPSPHVGTRPLDRLSLPAASTALAPSSGAGREESGRKVIDPVAAAAVAKRRARLAAKTLAATKAADAEVMMARLNEMRVAARVAAQASTREQAAQARRAQVRREELVKEGLMSKKTIEASSSAANQGDVARPSSESATSHDAAGGHGARGVLPTKKGADERRPSSDSTVSVGSVSSVSSNDGASTTISTAEILGVGGAAMADGPAASPPSPSLPADALSPAASDTDITSTSGTTSVSSPATSSVRLRKKLKATRRPADAEEKAVEREPQRGAGIDVELARKATAARLARVDQPTLEIEVSTDSGPVGKAKAPPQRDEGAKAEAEGEATSVSVSIECDKGRGKPMVALPPRLVLGSGSSARGSVMSSAGGPIIGRLLIGGARVGFALHQGSGGVAGAPTEWLTRKGGSLDASSIGSSLGIASSLALDGVAVARMSQMRSFVTSLDDGVPVPKVTVIDAAEAVAVEAAIQGSLLKVKVRRASLAEARRQEAMENLTDAEASDNYDLLHGRIVAAKARGVNQRRLDAAAARLKTFTPVTASKADVLEALQWVKVTSTERSCNGGIAERRCCSRAGCSVGEELEGQTLSFIDGATAEALGAIQTDGVPHDRWLFERISEAAAASADAGGVWKSGGKYILSALSRNQSPVALHRYLTGIGHIACANGIAALVKWTEATYDKHVSAVQINVHLDSMCFHAQHRDIYGLEQRDMAGRDCTCSFQPNIATACLSLGSTRKCLTEAEVDDFSEKSKCCEECEGFSCSYWLRSGNLMYFNDVWNRSHNHGIPANGGDADDSGTGGPRISIALLCAAPNDPLAMCAFEPGKTKAKNIYSTLLEGRK